jgi:hypothetical protein
LRAIVCRDCVSEICSRDENFFSCFINFNCFSEKES